MRAGEADERDSSWQQHAPRFRAFVYRGADSAVTALDIVDASVEEALRAARDFAGGDAHLWSLALVATDEHGRQGLVWLSGMDYHDTPNSRAEWQRRRHMQVRYLAARAREGSEPVLPNGLRVIRMFPEWVGGWPLWESFTDSYRLTGQDLGLADALSDALLAWNFAWMERQEDEPVPDGWLERGKRLHVELQAQLRGIAEVRPEFLC